MLTSDEHDGIVARLYGSAMGDVPWTATLAHISDRFGCSASLMQISDPAYQQHDVQNHGYSQAFAETFYASEIYANDPRVPVFRKVRPGSIYYDHALFDVDEMSRVPSCIESVQTLGVKYQLGAIARLPNATLGALALLSTDAEGHASEAAIAAFRRLAPHIEQACSLGHILEHQAVTRAVLLESLARKADAVILLGHYAAPTFMNDAAQTILAGNDGLRWSDGVFTTGRASETRRLQEMIRHAIGASLGADVKPGGQMLVTRPSGKRPYVLRVMPAPATERFLAVEAIACVIYVHDLSAERLPSKASLAAIFGLTEREADLAVELVRCTSLASAATNAGMALNTARNHLQSIFRKSGTTNQAEAVQLFSRLL